MRESAIRRARPAARAWLLPGGGVLLAAALTACGGSSPAPAPSTSASTSSSSASSAAPTSAAPTVASPTTSATTPSVVPPATGLGTRPPVPVASAATFAPGITATVITIEPITATASLPGEIGGPAVRLTVALQNRSSSPLDLGNVTVDLQNRAKSSATPLSGNGSKPFTGTAAAGGSATGVYVFALPVAERTGVSLYVTCNTALPVVVFTGDLGQ